MVKAFVSLVGKIFEAIVYLSIGGLLGLFVLDKIAKYYLNS